MKKQRFLFALLMAIVMMSMSPMRAWAQEECEHSNLVYEESTPGYHNVTCSDCGTDLDEEACNFDDDGVCEYCQYHCEHEYLDSDDFNHTCIYCEHSEEHNYENGICTVCNHECMHVSKWLDGVCEICSKECTHEWSIYETGHICNICKLNDSHSWFDGRCEHCGKECTHDWSIDETGHRCTICDINDPHDWDSEGICRVCEYKCEHPSYNINSTYHSCPICHFEERHEWNAGTCNVCGKTCDHHWEEGTCTICYTDCSHQYRAHDEESHICSICSHTEDHSVVTDEAVDATCTESGRSEGSHCSVCGDVLVVQEEISALGHTPVTDEAVAATCTTTGLTEGSHCSVCSDVLVVQEEIPVLGHAFSEELSLCDDGYHHYACTREECDVLSDDKYVKMFGEYSEVTGEENPTATIQLTKVGSYYYTSLYTDFPYVVSGNDVAYYVTSVGDGVVTLDNTADVRAGSGVIIRSENSECTIVYDPEGFENTAPEDNLLSGTATAITEPNATQYAFGLSNEGFLGFWRWEGMEIPDWKAYLDLGSDPSGARGFRIVFDDETTGIHQLPADASAIGCYDQMGRKVREVKGLGIVNGKKVIVK